MSLQNLFRFIQFIYLQRQGVTELAKVDISFSYDANIHDGPTKLFVPRLTLRISLTECIYLFLTCLSSKFSIKPLADISDGLFI